MPIVISLSVGSWRCQVSASYNLNITPLVPFLSTNEGGRWESGRGGDKDRKDGGENALILNHIHEQTTGKTNWARKHWADRVKHSSFWSPESKMAKSDKFIIYYTLTSNRTISIKKEVLINDTVKWRRNRHTRQHRSFHFNFWNFCKLFTVTFRMIICVITSDTWGYFLGTYTIMLFRCLCYYVYQSSFSHNIRLPVLAYLTSAHYNNANAGSVNWLSLKN